jgi:adenosine deaminase
VLYESDPLGLLSLMRQKRIAVEINLASNDAILGVKGTDHPFAAYVDNRVPVVLCTDYEGVLRTDLTQQFLRAVVTYGLNYQDVKTLVRNSLEYSFLPGASYWRGGNYEQIVDACSRDQNGKPCHEFLDRSSKAHMQRELEDRFTNFETANRHPH